MAGITGMNANTAKMMSQLLSSNAGGKKGQLSGSFNISTNTTSPAMPGLGFTRGASSSYKLDVMYFNDGTGNTYNRNLPAYEGLTKGEPTMTADELEQALVALAKEASASGKDYAETAKLANELIDKHICSVSPDRAGAAAKGSVSVPANCNNFMARIVGEDNKDDCIGVYQANYGKWIPFPTKDEIEASRPFADLFHDTFFGLDSGGVSGGSAGGSGNVNESSSITVDIKA